MDTGDKPRYDSTEREIAMAPRIGYLLPTRENTMAGQPEAVPLLQLAERAAGLGFNSI